MGQITFSERKGFRILLKPSQMVLRDFQVSVEKINNQFNYGITLGYRPSFQKGGEMNGGGHGLGFSYRNANYSNWLYEGVTLEGNGKYYFNEIDLYVEAVLFHKLWWFDNKMASYSNVESTTYDFNGLRSERVNVTGCKLLFGKTAGFWESGLWSGTVDFYAGLGIRYRNLWYKTKTINVDGSSDKTEILKDGYWFPSLQLGCKIGIQKRANKP